MYKKQFELLTWLRLINIYVDIKTYQNSTQNHGRETLLSLTAASFVLARLGSVWWFNNQIYVLEQFVESGCI